MSVYCHVKGEACIVSSFPLHIRTSMLIVQLMLWCLSAPSNIWHLQPCDCTRSCGSNGAEWKKAQRGSLWLFITAQSPLTDFPPGRINEGAWLMTSSRMSLYPARSSRRCCPTSILRPGVIKNGARLSPASSPLPSLCGVPDLSRLIALSVCPPCYW